MVFYSANAIWLHFFLLIRCCFIVTTIASLWESNAEITKELREDAYCVCLCVSAHDIVDNARRQQKCDKVKSEIDMEWGVAFAFYVMPKLFPSSFSQQNMEISDRVNFILFLLRLLSNMQWCAPVCLSFFSFLLPLAFSLSVGDQTQLALLTIVQQNDGVDANEK